MVCLVTYDLNQEVVRPKIVKLIDDNWNWARLSESSYAIDSDDPVGAYATLSKILDSNDQLYVITLKLPYEGQGGEEVNQWLADRLTW